MLYDDPKKKEVLIVRLNHYQDYTTVIFTAVVAADMKLDGNASDGNKHIPVFTYTACHEWSPLRSKWIMECGLL